MNKKTFGYIVLLGSAWGLAECGLGAGLKACASSISGSVMTAVALFFIAAAWVAGQGTSVQLMARPGIVPTGEYGGSGSTPLCLKSTGAYEGSGSSGEGKGSSRRESSVENLELGGGRKVANVALLVAVAIGFKMFDALLLGVPLRSGAITHPVFAFVLEGAGFLVVGALLMRSRKPSSSRGEAKALRSRFMTTAPELEVKDANFPLLMKTDPGRIVKGALCEQQQTSSIGPGDTGAQSPSEPGDEGTISPRSMTSYPEHLVSRTRLAQMMKSSPARGILWGGASALIAAAAFPLVKFASGIPACVVPGSTIPMVWAYAPLAVGLSMLAVPLGFKTAEKARDFISGPVWRIPAAVLLSLALWGSGLNF